MWNNPTQSRVGGRGRPWRFGCLQAESGRTGYGAHRLGLWLIFLLPSQMLQITDWRNWQTFIFVSYIAIILPLMITHDSCHSHGSYYSRHSHHSHIALVIVILLTIIIIPIIIGASSSLLSPPRRRRHRRRRRRRRPRPRPRDFEAAVSIVTPSDVIYFWFSFAFYGFRIGFRGFRVFTLKRRFCLVIWCDFFFSLYRLTFMLPRLFSIAVGATDSAVPRVLRVPRVDVQAPTAIVIWCVLFQCDCLCCFFKCEF